MLRAKASSEDEGRERRRAFPSSHRLEMALHSLTARRASVGLSPGGGRETTERRGGEGAQGGGSTISIAPRLAVRGCRIVAKRVRSQCRACRCGRTVRQSEGKSRREWEERERHQTRRARNRSLRGHHSFLATPRASRRPQTYLSLTFQCSGVNSSTFDVLPPAISLEQLSSRARQLAHLSLRRHSRH